VKKALLAALGFLFFSGQALAQVPASPAVSFSSASAFADPVPDAPPAPVAPASAAMAQAPAHVQQLIPAATPDQASDIVGSVVQIEGTATVKQGDSDAPPVTLTESTPIHLHDVVMTGPSTHALLLLIDNTQVTLGENATFSVDDYQFDPDAPDNNKARYSFLTGAFQYVSGAVAKIANPDVQLATPYGEIGIRGTTVWGGEMDDEQFGVFVQEGHVTMTTNRGRIGIDQGQGTSVHDINAVPSPAAPWSPQHIQDAIHSVRLKDAQRATARIALLSASHRAMIANYKAMMTIQRTGGMNGLHPNGGASSGRNEALHGRSMDRQNDRTGRWRQWVEQRRAQRQQNAPAVMTAPADRPKNGEESKPKEPHRRTDRRRPPEQPPTPAP
jgi:hypothetical protein